MKFVVEIVFTGFIFNYITKFVIEIVFTGFFFNFSIISQMITNTAQSIYHYPLPRD